MKDLAAREFRSALHRKRDYPPAWVGLGNLSFENGNLQNAEAYYRRALKKAPDHPMANNNLAMVYLSRGTDLDKAERFAKRALSRGGSIRRARLPL